MKKIIFMLALVAPFSMAFAADSNESGLGGVLGVISGIMNVVLPMLVAFAVIWFVYSVIKYTITGDDKTKEVARKNITKSLVGLFIIVGFWGIIALVINTFDFETGLGGDTVPFLPTVGDTESDTE